MLENGMVGSNMSLSNPLFVGGIVILYCPGSLRQYLIMMFMVSQTPDLVTWLMSENPHAKTGDPTKHRPCLKGLGAPPC